ncbi:type II secretion system F family protein [Asanoa sp. WMMD1127]|uniref:type II secretion system F family protein n=1 Tax=Asanoa sp. WMMD1127 TaxID=3016107 RepID=UPI0024173F95|nr:type II secretion system F family protein [Asanoa sp. WMMD1127]MDG4821869.1 type II secretion system F family protein [Asanoa sp. WMMD1127]
MVNVPFVSGVLGGALIGAGVFVIVRESLPAAPALAPALRRLHQSGPPVSSHARRNLDWLGGLSRWLRPPTRDLALLGRTPEQYALSLLVAAGAGLLAPVLLTLTCQVLGIGVPFFVPVIGSLGLAAVAAFVAHRDVLSKADRARREFSRAVCTYLDLVALQLTAAHGPVQALENAAAVCDGWVFERIRSALRMAQLQMHSPWEELRELSEEIGVPELGDVGAIMQSSGTEGAQVHETLRNRADSLRDQIRTDNLSRAEAVTGRLDIPGAMLVFVLMGFVLYPFLTRV